MKLFNSFFKLALAATTLTLATACSEEETLRELPPTVAVSNIKFQDTDNREGKIEGKLTWTLPTVDTDVENYVIYLGETQLTEVSKDTKEFMIPANTDFKASIMIVAKNKIGESALKPKLAVEDYTFVFVPKTLKAYITNEGKNESNNATLTSYDPATKEITQGVFQAINGQGLGDSAQDIIVYGSKMYIAVYGSQLIFVTDLQGKIIDKVKLSDSAKQPRSFTTDNGSVYVSLYEGYVGKIDTTSYSVETVKVGPNPEELAVANGKLYVANSGGMNWEHGYDKTVSVIDLKTFTETKKIEVAVNPCAMVATAEGDVYLVSNGNYKDVPKTLQHIDSKTDEVKALGGIVAPTWMAMGAEGKLYVIGAEYDENWNMKNTYKVLDTKTNKVLGDFITDVPDGIDIQKAYSINVDPVSGDIYIGTSDYTNNGDMYVISKEGKFVNRFEVGLNPGKVCFLTNIQ